MYKRAWECGDVNQLYIAQAYIVCQDAQEIDIISAKTVAFNDAVNFDHSYVQVASLFLHTIRTLYHCAKLKVGQASPLTVRAAWRRYKHRVFLVIK